MDKEDVKRLAKKPGLIPGVYNYCDRWCERCPLTARCMNYAMQAQRRKGGATPDIRSQEFWDELSSVFKVTLELLRESASQYGIDIDNLDPGSPEEKEEEERREEETENHPIAKAAMAYIDMVDTWMKNADGLFQEKRRDLNREARLQLPDGRPHLQAVQVADAADVISCRIHPTTARRHAVRSASGEGGSRLSWG